MKEPWQTAYESRIGHRTYYLCALISHVLILISDVLISPVLISAVQQQVDLISHVLISDVLISTVLSLISTVLSSVQAGHHRKCLV